MNGFDRATLQMLITKLDLSQITVKEVKEFCLKRHGLKVEGHTREQVVSFLCKQMKVEG